MDEEARKLALAAAKNVSPFMGLDMAGFSDAKQPAVAPQPAELPGPAKPVGIHVSNDAGLVYLHIEGKRPYGMTIFNARELALALRQACNRVEKGLK